MDSYEIYDRVPTLKTVSAAANPAGGVTLELSGFFKAITPSSPGTVLVKVGGQTALVTPPQGDKTTITATLGSPASAAPPGPAEVAVTVDGVPADTCGKKFTLPSVAAVDPPAVPATGETPLRITGSGFTGATKVRIGTVELGKSDFKVADDGLITATAPPGEVGPVQVGVETATGPAVGTATITYHPVVTGVIPPSGSAVGGEAVRLVGRGLAGVKEVRFGSAPAPSASPSGAAGTEATATTPAHDPSSVPVTVSAAGLASMPRHGASLPSFTFDPVPVPPDGGEPTPDPGGSGRNDPPPQEGAPPGGNSPGTSPSPGVTPTPAGAPSPGASPSPGAAPSPGASPTPAGVQVPAQAPVNAPVQSPGQAPGQAPVQAPSQAPAQSSAQASAPPLAPASAPAPAPGAATNGPSSGGIGNDQGQEKGASKYAMSAVSEHATALGLAGAATAMGVGWLVLSAAEARTVAGCRRSRRRTRARPKGAY